MTGQACRRIVSSSVVALAILLAGCAPTRQLVEDIEAAHPEAVFSVSACDSLVALTLDDGPSPVHTPGVLDVLAAHDAQATFFVIGERVAAHPDLAARAVSEGHELANHGWTLTAPLLLGAGTTAEHIERTNAVLASLDSVRWFRPGVGIYTRGIREAAEARGLQLALGSVYPNDPWMPWPGVLVGRILSSVRPGDVIVLHDGLGWRTRAVPVLERILPELTRRGYRVVTLSELVDASAMCQPSAS